MMESAGAQKQKLLYVCARAMDRVAEYSYVKVREKRLANTFKVNTT